MPTNQLLGRTSCPRESKAKLVLTRAGPRTLSYLWRHEFRSTAERARGRAIPHVFLAQTIVRNLDMSIQGQENVIKLKITVDDAVLMEVFQRQADLGGIESIHC